MENDLPLLVNEIKEVRMFNHWAILSEDDVFIISYHGNQPSSAICGIHAQRLEFNRILLLEFLEGIKDQLFYNLSIKPDTGDVIEYSGGNINFIFYSDHIVLKNKKEYITFPYDSLKELLYQLRRHFRL